MNYRFESKKSKDSKTKIELVCDSERCVTVIKYPEVNPQDRVEDEYGEDSQSE